MMECRASVVIEERRKEQGHYCRQQKKSDKALTMQCHAASMIAGVVCCLNLRAACSSPKVCLLNQGVRTLQGILEHAARYYAKINGRNQTDRQPNPQSRWDAGNGGF